MDRRSSEIYDLVWKEGYRQGYRDAVEDTENGKRWRIKE